MHAKGSVVEMLAPQFDWHALDIATAAGRAAFAVAQRRRLRHRIRLQA
ncbi:hypothetical protein K0U73_03075 [bacterium]|nr:hypothetical protein [Acidimicrobiaceae bacterium]MCH9802762.1 hypothetical protein [bacterium]